MSAPLSPGESTSDSFNAAVSQIAALRKPKEEPAAEASAPEPPPPADTTNAVVEGDDLEVDETVEDIEAPGEGDDAAPAEGEEPPAQVETLDDLAKAFGTDIPTLAAQVKVALPDGSTVPLATVLETHRNAPELMRARAEMEAKGLDLARREAEVHQLRGERLDQLSGAAKQLIGYMEAAYGNIDLAALKQTDPVEYLRVKNEIDEMQGAIRHSMTLHDQEVQQMQAQARQARAVAAEQEGAKLRALPEWRDQAQAQKNAELIQRYMAHRGIPLSAWEGESPSHVRVQMALDAARYWELTEVKKPAVLKKFKNLPPVARPGARAEESVKTAENQKKRLELLQRHRKAGTPQTAADAIRALRENR